MVVIVLAVIVILCWEGLKKCWTQKDVRLRALRARSGYGKMTKDELKELQRLLALEPSDLTDAQGLRLLQLRDETSMPSGTSPVPTIPSQFPTGSSSSSVDPLPPRRPTTRDQGVQKDYVPVFQRVVPEPPVRVETFAGPFHHVPGADVIHLQANCWGLRNTGRAQVLRLCRCCVENGGRSLYDR